MLACAQSQDSRPGACPTRRASRFPMRPRGLRHRRPGWQDPAGRKLAVACGYKGTGAATKHVFHPGVPPRHTPTRAQNPERRRRLRTQSCNCKCTLRELLRLAHCCPAQQRLTDRPPARARSLRAHGRLCHTASKGVCHCHQRPYSKGRIQKVDAWRGPAHPSAVEHARVCVRHSPDAIALTCRYSGKRQE